MTTKTFSEKYQFELNGCNTGKHEFSSDSQSDVKQQLCDALQDEKLNKFCAQPLRKSFFDKECTGVAWSPVYPQPSQPSQPDPSRPAPSQTSDRDYAKEREVRDALSYVLVESYKVTEGLATDVAQFAEEFSADMRSCGFSYVGPKCLNYHAYAGSYEGILFDPNGEAIFMTDLRFDSINSPILMAFKIKDDNGIKSEDVKVYVKIQEKSDAQSIEEYLDSQAVQLISTAKISENFIDTAKQRVQSPSDLKELYHMAQQLNELNMRGGNTDTSLSKFLVDQVKANKALVGESTESDYQYRTYSLFKDLGAKKAALIEVASELLKSQDDSVKQFGAVQVLINDSSKTELKSLVVKALGHSKWDTRRGAVTALSQADPTIAEQNKIIGKMDDNDGDVRKEATRVANKLSLSEQHIATLKSLSGSKHWTTRRDVATLIAKIPGTQASNHLVDKMSDNDGDVRNEVFSLLNGRNMDNALVASLESQLSSKHWTTRRDSAKLLGKIKTQDSLNTLLDRLEIETDGDVKAQINKSIAAIRG